jgi:hypothetical protein
MAVGPLAGQASASHFRGGDINYQQTGSATTAQFETTVSFRCTFFFASCPAVGTTVSLNRTLYGDGSLSPGQYTVLASNAAEDNFTAREVHTHTYADTTRRIASLSSCCTLSTLINNSNAGYALFADVNLAQDPNSPKTSVPPVVNVGSSGNQTFLVPATDAGGQQLRWRLATNAEADGSDVNPADYSINPSTGQVTFDTTGKTQGLYHSSIVIEALNGSGNVVSATLVTFLVRVGQQAGNQAPQYDTPPTPPDGTEYTVAPGSNLTIDLQASDPDSADTVEIIPGPLPSGATFNETSGNPATGSFSFTPSASQDGQNFVVNFTAQDGQGGSTFRSYTIRVRAPSGEPGRMVGKGSLTGSGKKFSYAYILGCMTTDPDRNFRGSLSGQSFKLTGVSSVTCTDEPGVSPADPGAGFDTQTGSGTGTLGGAAVTVEWTFVDGGPEGANDSAQITIRNGAGSVVFQGSGSPPGPFPGSRQATGINTAQPPA